MIIVQNHIPVKKEFSQEFEKRFMGSGDRMSNIPGFVRNEILRPVAGDEYIVLTYWEDKESFENWTSSDHFKKVHSESPPMDMFSGKNHLSVHEVIAR